MWLVMLRIFEAMTLALLAQHRETSSNSRPQAPSAFKGE
jgi:hypothetical protein